MVTMAAMVVKATQHIRFYAMNYSGESSMFINDIIHSIESDGYVSVVSVVSNEQ